MSTTRAVLRSLRTAFRSAQAAAHAQRAERRAFYQSGFRAAAASAGGSGGSTTTTGRGANLFCGRGGSSSILDFAPERLYFKRRCQPAWSSVPRSKRQAYYQARYQRGRASGSRGSNATLRGDATHGDMPCPNAFAKTIWQFMVEAHLTTSTRRNAKSCPKHGRGVTTPLVGGNGGGRARIKYNILLKKQQEKCRQKQVYEKARTRASLQSASQLRLAGPLLSSSDSHTYSSNSSPPSFHQARLRPFYFPSAPSLVPPSPFHARSLSRVCPEYSTGILRLFSTSSPARGLPVLAAKMTGLLKNSDSLSYINLLFRISVSFIPLSLRRAAMARKARLASLAAGVAIPAPVRATLFKVVCRTALGLPFILLLAVLLASVEITPISGRWRLLLLSETEERDIVNKVLEVGTTEGPLVQSTASPMVMAREEGSRDWLAIMRAVLGEEDAAPGTLLGGRVLDSRTDWRAQLAKNVLVRLESGIPLLAGPLPGHALEIAGLRQPSLRHPLGKASRTSTLTRNNTVIVIDRPESNAFSFGFFGSVDRPEPGVVIVFTGAIEEIMHAGLGGLQKIEERTPEDALVYPKETAQRLDLANEPSWLRSFFGSIVPSRQQGQQRHLLQNYNDNVVVVNKEQENALAVLLAHELAHLVLSHTIESYASSALLWPQLEKLGWDMLRVFIYPITALLGPFVQDAISATVKAGYEESSGLLPALTSSCESRKMETEADLVALRLLANAGIDPRSAVEFWEERLAGPACSADSDHSSHLHAHTASAAKAVGTAGKEGNSFVRTHPADLERIQAIKKELKRWEH